MATARKIPFAHDSTLPFHASPRLNPAVSEEQEQHARAMVDAVLGYAPATDSDALRLLRASFPDSPLGLRVAALALLARRRGPGIGMHYIPR